MNLPVCDLHCDTALELISPQKLQRFCVWPATRAMWTWNGAAVWPLTHNFLRCLPRRIWTQWGLRAGGDFFCGFAQSLG